MYSASVAFLRVRRINIETKIKKKINKKTLIVLNSAKRVKNKISILLRPYENSKVIDLLFSIEKNSPKLHDSVETFWFCLATFAIYFKR